MSVETGERRSTAAVKTGGGGMATLPPPAETDHLPCPRCDSTNTKFCYYNNYNFSQPRHFCKSCRRYWTHGGTLRDIPVGGGTRKNAKRPRASSSSSSTSHSLGFGNFTSSSYNPATTTASSAVAATVAATGSLVDPVFVALSSSSAAFVGDVSMKPQAANVGGLRGVPIGGPGSFTSLLSSSSGPPGGFLALGGFGLGVGVGLGPGLEDSGFGLIGRGMWAFPEVDYLDSGSGAAGVGVAGDGGNCGGGGGNSWQLESGEDQQAGGNTGGGGFVGSDCFSSWPELAISTPGNGLE